MLAFTREEPALQRLFLSAQYSQCLAEIANAPITADSALLAAAVYARMRRYPEILEALALGEPYGTADQRCEAHALAALAFAASGNHEESRKHLACISESELASLSPSVRARVDYHRAVCAWGSNDLIEAEAIMIRSTTRGDSNAEGRCKLMRSWIRAKRGRTAEQAALLVEAIEALLSSPTPDVGAMAQAAHVLSACVREVYLPEAFSALQQCIERIPWTDDLRLEHFQTLRLTGWAYSLSGEYIPAIRYMQLARDIAPTPYYDVLSR